MGTPEQQRAFWMTIRQALLLVIDAIERWLDISPTTATIRAEAKRAG